MEKERTTRFIGIGAQKGGVGKSSITTLLASYLYFSEGYNLAVIDCDYPQHSIAALRQRDKEDLEQDPTKMEKAKAHFRQLGKKAYKIETVTPKEALKKADQILQELPYLDCIFFDLPGSINVQGVLELSLNLDYVFSPLLPDMQTIASALTYAKLLYEHGVLLDSSNLKAIYLFWNQIDGREKTQLIDIYSSFFEEEGIGVLKSFLPRSVRFNKETAHNNSAVFRSTFYPPDKQLLKDSNIRELAFEIMNIVNQ